MKIRNNFVSNSSTCSFVIAGWRGKPEPTVIRKLAEMSNSKYAKTVLEWTDERITEDIAEAVERCGWSYEWDTEIYGTTLMWISSDSGYEEVKDFSPILQEAIEQAKKLGLEPPRLYGGITCC